ncbi:RNA polymerase ECF-type sigma factor [Rhodopirellula baltica SH28]|uniref:RNA polymerase ECF-type sigma factor n=1 Tax=Rhodopirellula baltica SH28 TaxID=993517 RepID=K5CBK3_RHOBT|nr:sigma-70 family RNA polymerase sigma factor [Rhodopirellula baltica]EKK00770.1 RNA polymerase ECF-type sigma factor [Rhodopirellula baltica SH28]
MTPTVKNVGVHELGGLALSGDQAAFGQLVGHYSGMVTGVAHSVLGDFARSEDAGQEAFLEAWKKRDTLRDPAKFASWVCSIARHRALDIARKSKRREEHFDATLDTESPDTDPLPVDALAQEEERQLVWATLDGLPEKYRETMVLYYRGEQSVAMVAESIGESEAAVRQRLTRGRQMLRNEVQRLVESTLKGTAPTAAFTACVMGAMPGNASAAIAATAAISSTKTSGAATAGKLAGGAAGAGLSGAVLGTLGGLLGGGIGTYFTHRNAPYASQKRSIVRFTIVTLLLIGGFIAALSYLVAIQTSDSPFDDTTYALFLLSLIVGFQLLLMGVVILMLRQYRRLGEAAKLAGDELEPRAAAFQQSRSCCGRSWSSERRLLGRPLLDIQFSPRDAGGIALRPGVARGWIAIGDVAYGWFFAMGNKSIAAIAIGNRPIGIVSVGAMSIGVISMGGLTIGLISLGGLAVGWWSLGGFALGGHAVGGAAFGIKMAAGGAAASMGSAKGATVFSDDTSEAAVATINQHWLTKIAEGYTPDFAFQISLLVATILVVVAVVTRITLSKLQTPSHR